MITRLPRTVIDATSPDGADVVRDWLDGLITNSVRADTPVFAALLTPQGKIIADMVVTPITGGFRLDTPKAMGAELLKRLKMYTLRAPITVEDASESVATYAVWDEAEDDLPAGAYPDPRHASLGYRAFGVPSLAEVDLAAYDAHRLGLGVPDSLFDYGPSEVFPHDADMDEMNGIDLKKGCFVGQEVVSRMARLGTVRKRMRAVVLESEAEAGDPIQSGSRRVGDILHVHGNMAMALVRLDRMEAATEAYTVGDSPVRVMEGPNG